MGTIWKGEDNGKEITEEEIGMGNSETGIIGWWIMERGQLEGAVKGLGSN